MEKTEIQEVVCPNCGKSNPPYWYCSCLPREDGLDRILLKRDENQGMHLPTVQSKEEKSKNKN